MGEWESIIGHGWARLTRDEMQGWMDAWTWDGKRESVGGMSGKVWDGL
jgi:hypothetical protein